MNFKLELVLRLDLDNQFEMRLEESSLPDLILKFTRVSEQKDKRYGDSHFSRLAEKLFGSLAPQVRQS